MKRTYILMLMMTALALSTNAHAQDTSNGIIWYPPIQVSDDTQWSAGRSKIALSGDDTVNIVWMTDKDTIGAKRLPFARSVDGGQTFFPAQELLPDSSAFPRYAAYPYILANHSYIYVLFMNPEPPQPFYSPLRMVASTDGGMTFDKGRNITTELTDGVSSTSLWSDVTAGVLILIDGRRIIRTTNGGLTWTRTDEIINYASQIAYTPGNLHWVGHWWTGLTIEIQYRRSTDLGTSWQLDTILSTQDGYYSDLPTIASYQTECGTELLTAWRDTKYGAINFAGASIISRAGLNNGDVWLPENLLTTEPRGTEPRSAVHGGTRAVSWWDEIALLVFNGMVRATNSALTEFPQAKDLSPAPATGGAPNAIAVSSHAVHVVYEQLVGGNLGTFRIFYRRGEFIQKNVTFGLSTGLLDFDSTDVGESTIDTITISNSGTDSLIIGTAISDNQYFAVSPATTVVPPASTAIFTVRFTPTSPGEQTGKIIFYHNGQTSPDCFAVTGFGRWRRETINYQHDWNLVSIPVKPGYKHTLPSLFLYDSGYLPSDSLETGRGYWAKPDSQVLYEGSGIWSDTIAVKKGWNMIGSLSGPVLKNTIISVPDSLVSTDFYQFNGKAYSPSDTLFPGRAYWVKVKADGMLLLNATSSKQ